MSLSRERPQTKEKGRDVETLEAADQTSEVNGKGNGSQPANPIVVNKDLNQQKPIHEEEGPQVDTAKEINEKLKPTSEGLTLGNKSGDHASTEAIPNKKGNKAAVILRDDLQEGPTICTMNKMVSLSSESKGKGKEIACEITVLGCREYNKCQYSLEYFG
ncbi:hypothetical protein OIU74_023061 [Salix koriyanagi]|uniref:Uncharacterized protein n=1 Tax=Salix koriyanagi TaxID=2511006 RepID=A0A9Q0WCN5_9ROSI|nr:hypothetical protein OIU74_023061 [Salix koriyanagi]